MTPGTQSARSYRPELDGIRAIAILSVLGFHVGFNDWSGGFIGVDVFFVLSGWLICGHIHDALADGVFSPGDFFARRIRRLLPAAFACYAVVSLVVAFLFLPFEQKDYVRYLIGSAFFFNNVILMNEAGYFAPEAATNPLLHTWSLSIEEQFYLVAPWLALLLGRSARAFKWALVLALLVSLGLTLFSGQSIHSNEARYFSSVFRVWEIAAGGVAYVLVRGRTVPHSPGLPVVALLAVLVPIFVFDQTTLHPGPGLVVVVAGTLGLILLARPEHSRVGRVLGSRVLSYVGRISYSTYLWHWPLIVFWQYVGNDLNDVTRVLIILVSLGLGALSYRIIELPVRHMQVPAHNPRLFAAFAGQVAIVSVAAAGLWWSASTSKSQAGDRIAAILEGAGFNRDRFAACWYENGGAENCRFGNTGAQGRPILLWGDSMANSAVPAFDRLAQSSDAPGQAITSPGCAPLLDVVREADGARACLAANRAAVALLDDAPATDVYLFARWPLYTLGYSHTDAGKIGLHGFLSADLTPAGISNFEAVKTGLSALLDAIPERHRVTIIGPVPEYPYDVPSEMIRAIRFGGQKPAVSRTGFEAKTAETASLLETQARKAGARYVDLTNVFCTLKQCPPDRDGRPVLADMVHLSTTGNEMLFSALRDLNGVAE